MKTDDCPFCGYASPADRHAHESTCLMARKLSESDRAQVERVYEEVLRLREELGRGCRPEGADECPCAYYCPTHIDGGDWPGDQPTLPCGHPGLPTDNYCGYCGRRNALIDGSETP